MNSSQTAILRTLIYFEVFNHPLTGHELYGFVGIPLDRASFEHELETLVSRGIVGHEGDYYYLVNGHASIDERISKLDRAGKARRTALRYSRVIAWHPFVRGVFISGSLSKNSFAAKDDIDYFVVTEPEGSGSAVRS